MSAPRFAVGQLVRLPEVDGTWRVVKVTQYPAVKGLWEAYNAYTVAPLVHPEDGTWECSCEALMSEVAP